MNNDDSKDTDDGPLRLESLGPQTPTINTTLQQARNAYSSMTLKQLSHGYKYRQEGQYQIKQLGSVSSDITNDRYYNQRKKQLENIKKSELKYKELQAQEEDEAKQQQIQREEERIRRIQEQKLLQQRIKAENQARRAQSQLNFKQLPPSQANVKELIDFFQKPRLEYQQQLQKKYNKLIISKAELKQQNQLIYYGILDGKADKYKFDYEQCKSILKPYIDRKIEEIKLNFHQFQGREIYNSIFGGAKRQSQQQKSQNKVNTNDNTENKNKSKQSDKNQSKSNQSNNKKANLKQQDLEILLHDLTAQNAAMQENKKQLLKNLNIRDKNPTSDDQKTDKINYPSKQDAFSLNNKNSKNNQDDNDNKNGNVNTFNKNDKISGNQHNQNKIDNNNNNNNDSNPNRKNNHHNDNNQVDEQGDNKSKINQYPGNYKQKFDNSSKSKGNLQNSKDSRGNGQNKSQEDRQNDYKSKIRKNNQTVQSNAINKSTMSNINGNFQLSQYNEKYNSRNANNLIGQEIQQIKVFNNVKKYHFSQLESIQDLEQIRNIYNMFQIYTFQVEILEEEFKSLHKQDYQYNLILIKNVNHQLNIQTIQKDINEILSYLQQMLYDDRQNKSTQNSRTSLNAALKELLVVINKKCSSNIIDNFCKANQEKYNEGSINRNTFVQFQVFLESISSENSKFVDKIVSKMRIFIKQLIFQFNKNNNFSIKDVEFLESLQNQFDQAELDTFAPKLITELSSYIISTYVKNEDEKVEINEQIQQICNTQSYLDKITVVLYDIASKQNKLTLFDNFANFIARELFNLTSMCIPDGNLDGGTVKQANGQTKQLQDSTKLATEMSMKLEGEKQKIKAKQEQLSNRYRYK